MPPDSEIYGLRAAAPGASRPGLKNIRTMTELMAVTNSVHRYPLSYNRIKNLPVFHRRGLGQIQTLTTLSSRRQVAWV